MRDIISFHQNIILKDSPAKGNVLELPKKSLIQNNAKEFLISTLPEYNFLGSVWNSIFL
jgi:hypothetical protein